MEDVSPTIHISRCQDLEGKKDPRKKKSIEKFRNVFTTSYLWEQNETCIFIECSFGISKSVTWKIFICLYAKLIRLPLVYRLLSLLPNLPAVRDIFKGALILPLTCHTTKHSRGNYRHSKYHGSNLHLLPERVDLSETYPANGHRLMDIAGTSSALQHEDLAAFDIQIEGMSLNNPPFSSILLLY